MMVTTEPDETWHYVIKEEEGFYSLVEEYDEDSYAVILEGYESPQDIIDDLKLILKDVTNE